LMVHTLPFAMQLFPQGMPVVQLGAALAMVSGAALIARIAASTRIRFIGGPPDEAAALREIGQRATRCLAVIGGQGRIDPATREPGLKLNMPLTPDALTPRQSVP